VRSDSEGFGFQIVSSVYRSGSCIGKIIEGSPAARCGNLKVNDRIIAINGVNILRMHHGEIVNLIRDSGNVVTLTVGPPEDNPAAAAPIITSSNVVPMPREMTAMERPNSQNCFAVDLQRGSKGFGFSIRGGQEFANMPLLVLRIAEGGPAHMDGRLKVGDQLVEINGVMTEGMTHAEAIELIKREPIVRLLVKRQPDLSVDMNALADAIPENAYGRLGGNTTTTYSTYTTSVAPEPKATSAWSMVR